MEPTPQPRLSHEAVDRLHEEALRLNRPSFEQKLAATPPESDKHEDMSKTLEIARIVAEAGGLALVVGGYARDEALRQLGYDIEGKDIDIEVYGIEVARLQQMLHDLHPDRVNLVGSAFGVLKVGRLDISIPRRDSKVGAGHRGFEVTGDPTMSVREAARRRDFTMNALALNPLTGEIIDEYGGLNDLEAGIIRATDDELFGDDPLRSLRAMQFAGRFDFAIDPHTVEICRGFDLSELPVERIGEEWSKLMLKGTKPSRGLEAARELGIIDQLHPELKALFEVPQEPEWHPEGDVWIHTKMVVDAARSIVVREGLKGKDALVIMLAALCHDLGKPDTTEYNTEKERITSRGHEAAGAEPTKSFLKGIYVQKELIDRIVPLVKEHLYPSMHRNADKTAVRRLSHRLHPATIRELVMVAEADHAGRDIPWDGFEQGNELLQKALELEIINSRPTMLMKGQDLVDLGIRPGVVVGEVVRELYEQQMEGEFSDREGGFEALKKSLRERGLLG